SVICAYCVRVHAPSPTPAEGSIVIPSGSVTTVSLRSDWASASAPSSPSVLKFRSNASPLGEEAEVVVGIVLISGENSSCSQPVSAGCGSLAANVCAPGATHDSACRLVWSGPVHEVGILTNAGGCASSESARQGS